MTKILTMLFIAALTANLVFVGCQVYNSLGVKSDVINTLPVDNKIVYKADANAINSKLADESNAVRITDKNGKVATRVTINSNPTFATGKDSGDMMIVNNESSHSPQMVRIYTIPDNKLIYSGGLDAGQVIEKSTLLTDLPKGTHACFAVFYTVDAEGACHLCPYSTPVTITILA